jgi:hypothetical protein
MRRNDLHIHATAAALGAAGYLLGFAMPLFAVAMFYVGVLIRRYG